jgi:uncharacterized protein
MLDEFAGLIERVQIQSPLVHSEAHGDHHWRLVAWTGYHLLEQITGADPLVVLLFALFHDSQRENEYDDPNHGRRGGELARRLLDQPPWRVTKSQLDTLVTACDLHTEAERTDDPTLGVCWDSDRLNLWRVGIQPSLRYLSTAPARDVSRIEWTRKLQDQDIPWTHILEAYSELPDSGQPELFE